MGGKRLDLRVEVRDGRREEEVIVPLKGELDAVRAGREIDEARQVTIQARVLDAQGDGVIDHLDLQALLRGRRRVRLGVGCRPQMEGRRKQKKKRPANHTDHANSSIRVIRVIRWPVPHFQRPTNSDIRW